MLIIQVIPCIFLIKNKLRMGNMKKLSFTFILITTFFLNGCATKPSTIKVEAPIDFQFVTVQKNDTFELLAEKYTGSSALAWRIKEFNDSQILEVGQQIIVPFKPFRPGGLTAEGHQLIPVLSYHNFSDGPSQNKLIVSAKSFREQLQYLKSNNYHVITMDQLVEFINFGQVPKKSIVISIDDGWKSTYEVAYPILKEFGYNATLFIPTQFIDSGHELAMTWEQLEEIVSDSSMDIQCHTKSHRDLSVSKKNESFDEYIKSIEQDIAYSKQRIYSKLGKKVSALAYPFGKTNPLVTALIKKNGYQTAFTVVRKSNPFYRQSFLLNRAMVFGTHSISQFAKDLKYFEHDRISESEPIDSLQSLASIEENNLQDYEDSEQWRTALLGWKLRRDKLISKKQSREGAIKPASLDESIQKSKQKVAQLVIKLNIMGKKYYNQAMQGLSGRLAEKNLLKSLLFSPNNLAPIELFQSDMGGTKNLVYQVKQNDTLKSIAKHFYQDPKKAILISVFNESIIDNNSLRPGMEITLPSIPAEIKIKRTTPSRCGVVLTKSAKKLANEYYSKGSEYFDHDQISKAIRNLKVAICLNPKHAQAGDMLKMLNMLKDL